MARGSTLRQFCVLAAATAVCHGADDPASARTSLYAGVEIGNTDTRRIDAGALVQLDERWLVSAVVARADFELPDADAVSTLVAAEVSRDFGAVGVGLGLRRGEIEDVSLSRGWYASAFVDHLSWRFGVEI